MGSRGGAKKLAVFRIQFSGTTEGGRTERRIEDPGWRMEEEIGGEQLAGGRKKKRKAEIGKWKWGRRALGFPGKDRAMVKPPWAGGLSDIFNH